MLRPAEARGQVGLPNILRTPSNACGTGFFKHYRTHATEVTVAANRIVERLNVIGDVGMGE